MLCFPQSTLWPATARHSPIYHFLALVRWHRGPEQQANKYSGTHSTWPRRIELLGKRLSYLPQIVLRRLQVNDLETQNQKPPEVRAQPAASPAALPSPSTHPPDHFPTACATNSDFPVAFIFYWWAIKSPGCPINVSIIILIYLSPSPGKESRGGKAEKQMYKRSFRNTSFNSFTMPDKG